MSETPEEMTDEEYDAAVARRVRMIGLIVIGGALAVIALSALTLKADQVNDLPRTPIGGVQQSE